MSAMEREGLFFCRWERSASRVSLGEEAEPHGAAWPCLLLLLACLPGALTARAADETAKAKEAKFPTEPSACKVVTNDELEVLLSQPASLRPQDKSLVRSRCESPRSARGLVVVRRLVDVEQPAEGQPAAESATSPEPVWAADLSEVPLTTDSSNEGELAADGLAAVSSQDEIRPVRSRWHPYNLEGHPEISYHLYDPYGQNVLKGDFPLAGDWFLELTALNTMVYKSRRNLDFSRVFPDLMAAGTLNFVSYNSFYSENLIFGAEFRRHDDSFVPSNFRLRINGVADFKHDINALTAGSDGNAHLFDAFFDLQIADFGHNNFDLLFLRGGFQGFRSDFHGLVFNDVGLGGRLFGETKKNRLRYDFAYFKLFSKNPVSGFIDFSAPSRHQVAIARLTWEDFLAPGWNSEWTFHYNRDPRPLSGISEKADLDTFYFGATFNGRLGRWVFNPAVYAVTGHAERLEGAQLARHFVAGWMGLLDLQYPFDFWRFRLGYLYASGDSNSADRRDTGFDAISDGVVLFGGPLSYWVGENIKFGAGDFVRPNSLFPSFRGVNEAANYINPGLQVVNAGVDLNLSPRVAVATNVNYLRFVETGSYQNRIVIGEHGAGVEFNLFVRWKPFLRQLNENFVLDNGFSLLHPLPGLEGAFQSKRTVFSTFTAFRFLF